jgi:hypothetical protein
MFGALPSWSQLIFGQIERAVKDAEIIDVAVPKLFLQQANAMLHVIVRGRALSIRIRQSSLHHDIKGEFSHDLIVRAILRLFLNEPSEIFLCRRHLEALRISSCCHRLVPSRCEGSTLKDKGLLGLSTSA